jgi:hypothetical protein
MDFACSFQVVDSKLITRCAIILDLTAILMKTTCIDFGLGEVKLFNPGSVLSF